MLGTWIARAGRHAVTQLIFRLLVGGVFLVFGAVKLYEPHTIFMEAIASYQMVPESVIPIFAYTVLIAEVVLGTLLIVGLFTHIAAIGIAGLLVMFLVAIGQGMIRGLDLADCGCSGSLLRLGESAQQVFTRDALLLLCTAWILFVRQHRWTLDNWFQKTGE